MRWPEPIRWVVFRCVAWVARLKQRQPCKPLVLTGKLPKTPTKALWVFVSTIGELNAIASLLRRLQAQLLPTTPLVLITDRHIYQAAYAKAYPEAVIVQCGGEFADYVELAHQLTPVAMIVAEISARLHDSPCRLPYAALRTVKRLGAPVYLVNAWLYHEAPQSGLDKLERWLFDRDYCAAFDRVFTQDEAAKTMLLQVGFTAQQVAVVGNLKFDALLTPVAVPADERQSLGIAANRLVIVAGCIRHEAEMQLLLTAFAQLRQQVPALLVFAPRHPESTAFMAALAEQLSLHQFTAAYRTQTPTVSDEQAVYVLDTMGELARFYALADAAHIGVDHNVLEPIAAGLAVSCLSNWQARYPSFGIYQLASAQGLVTTVSEASQLRDYWAADRPHQPKRMPERTAVAEQIMKQLAPLHL